MYFRTKVRSYVLYVAMYESTFEGTKVRKYESTKVPSKVVCTLRMYVYKFYCCTVQYM